MAERAVMERVWQAHTDSEFERLDVGATMATMTDSPTVLHVPTAMGGRGRHDVQDFYARLFVGRNPDDFAMRSLSRTVGDERIVDEMVVSFTHDTEVPWVLPGIPPTGRTVTVPLIAVVGFRGEEIDSEHIYWDQACVLAQTGLLDEAAVLRLPFAVDQEDVVDGGAPLNVLARSSVRR